MAANQLNEEIQRTQQVLDYVRRPPLSLKLLSRPPFKFIHDLVSEVMKMLGEIPGRLFAEQELDKNAFSTKEQKVAYLEKIISWASYLVGHRVDVHVKNILAGKEPEKTNRLLQAIGRATKIAEGEPERGIEAADHANGKPTPMAAASATGKVSREKSSLKVRRPRTPKDGFEDDEEGAGPRIIKDTGVVSEEEDFQVVSVADGKIKTRQLNQREKLKDAKNVDEFEEHGILVRKILEMKRGIEEMERQGQEEDPEILQGQSDSKTGAGALDRQQKEREAIRFRREVAELRRKIQTLAGCVTPMGRQMDEVQIAVDVMLQEYAKWREENAFLRERLVQERTACTASLAPLQTKLRIIQADIADKVEHIRSQKRSIKLNDEKMRRILNKGIQMGKESH